MPVVQIQASITTAVQTASSISGLATTTPCGYGVLVCTPSANTGTIYYGYGATVATTSGMPIPNGVPYTINPNGMIPATGGLPTLANLFFIATTTGQTIGLEVQG